MIPQWNLDIRTHLAPICPWLNPTEPREEAAKQVVGPLLDETEDQQEAYSLERPDLHSLWRGDKSLLPSFVQESKAAMTILELLGPLEWSHFPERAKNRAWPGSEPVPRACFAAAYLVKLNKEIASMPKLWEYLSENPALVWLLGFPLVPSDEYSWGFDVEVSLCTAKHFSRVLREMENAQLQFLLTGTVHLLRDALPSDITFGDEISLDTKHIIAWVVENNSKHRMSDRYVKENQPKGDPDCKLGCKERKNQHAKAKQTKTHDGSDQTPTQEGMAASHVPSGEFYWGYASGLIATKVPEWGEFVLAEMTQTFNRGDATYFHPLVERTEASLGHKPRFGALDAAFDAYYVHDYFHQAGGFAAVPLRKPNYTRTFDEQGAPLCEADLPFSLKSTYFKQKNALVPHTFERYASPLLHPEATGQCCPIAHANWAKGGCKTEIASGTGARLRYQLDRESDAYKALYNQRSATERINSLAKELGIERPKLRNQRSITNQNTLIYILLNLRALQRVNAHKASLADQ